MFRILLLSALFFFIGYGIYSFFSKLLKGNSYSSQQRQRNTSTPAEEAKQFSKDMGEYVEYEEVRGDDKKQVK